jgi:hypothetical protein
MSLKLIKAADSNGLSATWQVRGIPLFLSKEPGTGWVFYPVRKTPEFDEWCTKGGITTKVFPTRKEALEYLEAWLSVEPSPLQGEWWRQL